MHLLALVTFIFAASSVAQTPNNKRSTTSLGQLYAYGSGLAAMPVFYDDGIAYIGTTSTGTEISFSKTSGNGSLIATPIDDTNASTWTTQKFYVDNRSGMNNPAGFIPTGSSYTTVTSTGFDVFGTSLVWIDHQGSLHAKWWAAETEEDGIWVLKWNVDNVGSTTANPVVIKYSS